MKRKLIKSAVNGVFVSASVCIILTFVMSFILLRTSDPTRGADVSALLILCISAFAGGLFAAKKNGGQGIVCGTAVGIAVCFALFVGSLFHESDADGYFMLFPVFLSALLGGFSGRPSVKRKRKKKNV